MPPFRHIILSVMMISSLQCKAQANTECKYLLDNSTKRGSYLKIADWAFLFPNELNRNEFVSYNISNLNGKQFMTLQFHFAKTKDLPLKLPKGMQVILTFQDGSEVSFEQKKAIKLSTKPSQVFYQISLDFDPLLLAKLRAAKLDSMRLDWPLERKEFDLGNELETIRKMLDCIQMH